MSISHKYDAATGLYNCTESSTAFFRASIARARVASIGGGSAATWQTASRVNVIGDSIVRGVWGSSPDGTYRYPQQVRQNLATLGYSVGEMPIWSNIPGDDPRWTTTGWNVQGANAPANTGVLYGGSGAAAATFGPVTCDGFVVYYKQQSNGGSFTVSIDGGTATTINSTNATQANMSQYIAASSNGSHTLTINAPTGSGYAWIIAVEPVNLANLMRVGALGVQGSATANWVPVTLANNNIQAFDMIAPDLTVIHLGTNDQTGSAAVPVATYKTNMTTLVQKARSINSDVLLVGPAETLAGLASSPRMDQFVAALYQVADEQNVVVWDLYRRWGAVNVYGSAPFSFRGDNLHPSAKGYSDIASGVTAAVRRMGCL